MPDYPVTMTHPDLPGATCIAGSAGSERVHAASGWTVPASATYTLDGMGRPELDDVAAAAGIDRPDRLPNKQAVKDAIIAGRTT